MISVRQRDLESALCLPTVPEQGSTGPLRVPTLSIHRPIQAERDEVASLSVDLPILVAKISREETLNSSLEIHFFGKILA